MIALALPETRRDRVEGGGFRGDVGSLFTSRAFIGYVLCQVLASQIIFAFAGGGPYIVVTQMGRTSAEYGAWFATTGFAYLIGNLFCVRFAPRHSLEKLIWFGLALQLFGSLLNLVWSLTGTQPGAVGAVRHPDDRDGRQRLRDGELGGRRHQRPPRSRRHRLGRDGIPAAWAIGALVSQFGAYLGGHSTTTLPLTAAIFVISLACASTMIFIVPRRTVVVSEELIEQAEEEIGDAVAVVLASPRRWVSAA